MVTLSLILQELETLSKTEHFLAQRNNSDHPNKMEDVCFREGLVRFLIGMSISMRQDIVNATMTHVDKSILIKIYIFS